jgi:hypothetical protein
VYVGNRPDLLWKSKPAQYDFVVAAGVDRAIRLRFDGVRSLRTDAEGNLILSTPAGDLIQQGRTSIRRLMGSGNLLRAASLYPGAGPSLSS